MNAGGYIVGLTALGCGALLLAQRLRLQAQLAAVPPPPSAITKVAREVVEGAKETAGAIASGATYLVDVLGLGGQSVVEQTQALALRAKAKEAGYGDDVAAYQAATNPFAKAATVAAAVKASPGTMTKIASGSGWSLSKLVDYGKAAP